MRRIASVILIVALLISLSACCLKHDWEDATCTTPKTCSKCGETEGEALGHDYSDWSMVVEPSYLSGGTKRKTCNRCGDTITEEVPRLSTDNCVIVDNSGMTVTAEECFYLLEEVLNGRTNYFTNSQHTFRFLKGKDAYKRELYCDGVDTDISVSMLKKGSAPKDEKEKIDYILMSVIANESTSDAILSCAILCETAVILITRPDIHDTKTAAQFGNTVTDSVNYDNWIPSGILEYRCASITLGSSVAFYYCVRVADQY
jgi:hypothetical protein